MANEIRAKNLSKASFTITLNSLAAGSARQSTLIDNSSSDYPMALVWVKVALGSDPGTTDGQVNVYLLRGNDPSSSDYRTDGAGASDAALTVVNAQPIASAFAPSTLTTSSVVYVEAVAGGLDDPLGPEWGIAVENAMPVALHASSGNAAGYVPLVPEIQ